MKRDTNAYDNVFPVQKLTMSKKTKEWKEACVDAIIGKSGTTGTNRKDNLTLYYGLYNSEFDIDDLKYVTNPYDVDDGFPASLQNFNIIKPKVDLLIGEETKRPNNMKIIQTNYDAITETQEKKKQLLTEYIMAEAGIDPNNPQEEDQLTLEEIQSYMAKSYKTMAEESAYNTMQYLNMKLRVDHEFFKGMKDAIIGGEEIYYTGILNGEPHMERINPKECDYDRDSEIEFIEDRDWFIRTVDMTTPAIYDRFFDLMDGSVLDKVLGLASGDYSMQKGADTVNTTSIVFKEKMSDKIFTSEEKSNSFTLPVSHVVWRSFKKVGFLTYTDETGEEQTEYVDESYKVDPGENIEWDWIVEIWEGYRIHDDIYIGIKPVDYQSVSIDNPNASKLPYTGAIYNNTNTKAKSLVAIMKPLQYMYIILWYRLELALSRDKGKVIQMDITQIPKSMGIDVHQWMHYLTASGVSFINPYEEGWDIPGREGGKPSSFNQMTSLDLTMSNVIAGYIDLISKIEEMIGELSGISKARQGQIHHAELVGNVEREVTQSSHITEPLFWMHNMVKKNTYTCLLNSAKSAWANSDKKKLHYILKDGTRKFIDLAEDFLYSDFDIFITDASQEQQNIQAIKNLLQPAMQNGASLLEVTDILLSDNISDIKERLTKIEQAKAEAQKAAMEMEQAMKQQETQFKVEELRIKEEDSIRKAETSIEVALIGADSQTQQRGLEGDSNDNGIKDQIDMEKLSLQQDKQRSDEGIKKRQVDEDVRKNKVAEKQKQEEIQIKRKQANKVTVNKN